MPVERQVLQSDFIQEPQSLENLLEQLLRNCRLLSSQLNPGKEGRCLLDRHARDLADVLAVNGDLPGFGTQPHSMASRTHRISAIPAEKHAHMQLVFLALQVCEEPADASETPLSVDNPLLLLPAELSPGSIERNVRLT